MKTIYRIGCVFVSIVFCFFYLNAASVILNEYNAVDNDQFLNNENSDVFFGRILGNGGDWFELVVVGDGTAGSTVDIREWRFEIYENGEVQDTLILSDNDYWSNVIAGTILTFIEHDTFDTFDTSTEINKIDNLSTEGWCWSNFYTGDETYFESYLHPHFPMSNEDSQIKILDSNNNPIFYAGEAINPTSGVQNNEVFKLEEDPTIDITPMSSYNSGSSSTFGHPNIWSSGTIEQNFSFYQLIYGDVNGDENVSSYDAALTLQYSAGLISDWTEEQITAGDVNGDENISSYDAALILQYSAGLIDEFPVEG